MVIFDDQKEVNLPQEDVKNRNESDDAQRVKASILANTQMCVVIYI